MNNKQKYYNYIVDDMVKKSELVQEDEMVATGFHTELTTFVTRYSYDTFFLATTTTSNLGYYFKEYIVSVYGVNDDEVEHVWKLYTKQIQNLINY